MTPTYPFHQASAGGRPLASASALLEQMHSMYEAWGEAIAQGRADELAAIGRDQVRCLRALAELPLQAWTSAQARVDALKALRSRMQAQTLALTREQARVQRGLSLLLPQQFNAAAYNASGLQSAGVSTGGMVA